MFVMIESPQNTQTLHFSKWNVTDQKEKGKRKTISLEPSLLTVSWAIPSTYNENLFSCIFQNENGPKKGRLLRHKLLVQAQDSMGCLQIKTSPRKQKLAFY